MSWLLCSYGISALDWIEHQATEYVDATFLQKIFSISTFKEMHSFPDCLCAPLLDIDNFRLALKTHLFAVQRPRSALEALRNVLYKSTITTSTTSFVELGFDGVFFCFAESACEGGISSEIFPSPVLIKEWNVPCSKHGSQRVHNSLWWTESNCVKSKSILFISSVSARYFNAAQVDD